MSNFEWIAIADPHLGAQPDDLHSMTGLIKQLDPLRQGLLFLGDLFHVWAGPEKFHTDDVKRLMASLWAFRQRGGRARLVVGNRDAFFAEVHPGEQPYQGLPFERIALDFDRIQTSGGLLLASHGDLVNSEDKAYLRWRKWMRSSAFRLAFELMPSTWAQKLMFKLEAQLRETNLDYKISFPEAQWTAWCEQLRRSEQPQLILVGHFHPSDAIITPFEEGTALVAPGWLSGRKYLVIKDDLSFESHTFSA